MLIPPVLILLKLLCTDPSKTDVEGARPDAVFFSRSYLLSISAARLLMPDDELEKASLAARSKHLPAINNENDYCIVSA